MLMKRVKRKRRQKTLVRINNELHNVYGVLYDIIIENKLLDAIY